MRSPHTAAGEILCTALKTQHRQREREERKKQVLGERTTKGSDFHRWSEEEVMLKHQGKLAGWVRNRKSSPCKSPVAGPVQYSDHIFMSVLDNPSCPGLLISSILFLSPKWRSLKDKLHGCPVIVVCSGNKKKPRVSGLQEAEERRLARRGRGGLDQVGLKAGEGVQSPS